MKVKDFLAQFEGADPESDVFFNISDGCCGDYEQLGDPDVDVEEKSKYFPHGMVQLRFPALWFFDTCITSGQARKAAEAHKKRVKGDDWKPGDGK
jgi:hypothetical protein